MNHDISSIADRLVARIRSVSSAAVAFSGGVDSAVVAKASVLALGKNTVAVTAVSPSLPEEELRSAIQLAETIGIRHLQLMTDEFQRPEYRANAGNRCFFCKDTLYTVTSARLEELQVSCILNGTNLDDLGDHRPGLQAAINHQVRSPLIEEGLNKAMVRALAKFWNLTVAEKPASPCLSSRIAYGIEVTEERVARIEQAEACIRRITGIQELRVRLEASELARIEVPLTAMSAFLEHTSRSQIASQLRALGFRRITLDLEGFRSGSLNDTLPLVQLGQSAPV